MSQDGPNKRIEFVRPDPTKFAVLIARTGRSTGVIAGTDNFKPTGTEWATDADMRDAGYVPLEDAKRAVHRVMRELLPGPGSKDAIREAMQLLGITE